MNWQLAPALVASALMVLAGIGAAFRPSVLERIGVSATTPLGTSEIRVVFGGMLGAFGIACIVLREPVVFGVVGVVWLADAAVRLVAVFVDRVPPREAVAVLLTALVMGGALISGALLG